MDEDPRSDKEGDRQMKKKGRAGVVLLSVLAISIPFGVAVQKIVKWKAYVWLPSYAVWALSPKEKAQGPNKHVIFLWVDHYEPGLSDQADRVNDLWCDEFEKVAARHTDSYGNRFRYSWFYPYNHKREAVLRRLSAMAYDGFGEVELHWHHPPANNDTFPPMLEEAVQWYQRYGALLGIGDTPRTQFGFIHGNWALDDSCEWISGGRPRRCGVTREMAFLSAKGCFADFTMPAFGTLAQPRKVNSIYYAKDTPEAKSYDTGVDAAVGVKQVDRFLMFEGPIGLSTEKMRFEYGAVESYALPSLERVESWIETNIHVKGKPEWVFVKVHSHGVQSSEKILYGGGMDYLLDCMEEVCRKRGFRLHYVTAREAYNLVQAAEDDARGDPEEYRDYVLPPPCNSVFRTTVPVRILAMSPGKICVESETSLEAEFAFHHSDLLRVKGAAGSLEYSAAQRLLRVWGRGPIEVMAVRELRVEGCACGFSLRGKPVCTVLYPLSMMDSEKKAASRIPKERRIQRE